ncbi:MAG: rod-binding protein [Hyphomonadaceae bacterium]
MPETIPPLQGAPLAPAYTNNRAPLSPQMQEIRRVAEEFEAMVLAELLQPVFEQIDPNSLGGGGSGEQMFRPMLIQEYAGGMARAGGIGIADSVFRELTRMQVIAPPAEAPPAAPNTTDPTDGPDR